MPRYVIHEKMPDGSTWHMEEPSDDIPAPYHEVEASQSVFGGFTNLPRWATIDGAFFTGMAFCHVRGKGRACHRFTAASLKSLLRCGDLESDPFK